MHILLYFLLTVHVLVCLLMILLVLMQRPRSEGLGAAFGGGMTENIFGAQTTNILARLTTWLGGTFFVLTLALAIVYSHLNSVSRQTALEKELLAMPTPTPAPAASPTPAPVGEALPEPAAAPAEPAPAVEEAPSAEQPGETTPTGTQPAPDAAATAVPLQPVPPAPVEEEATAPAGN